jgi:hypothetical protein
MPNTSQATANSKGERPLHTTAATVRLGLAAFFRTGTILPLVGSTGKVEDDGMFDVYCPRHRSRVLLFSDNVSALVNRPDALELHWRCTCGHTGIRRFSRSPRGSGPVREAA